MWLGVCLGDQRRGLLGLADHRATAFVEGLPNVGDAKAAARTLDQPHAQPRFQRYDAAAEFRLGFAQCAGASVFITGRRQDALDAAVKVIGGWVTAVRGDMSKLADIDASTMRFSSAIARSM